MEHRRGTDSWPQREELSPEVRVAGAPSHAASPAASRGGGTIYRLRDTIKAPGSAQGRSPGSSDLDGVISGAAVVGRPDSHLALHLRGALPVNVPGSPSTPPLPPLDPLAE